MVSRERIDYRDADVITCPYGELLLDGITQNPLSRTAFVTLQFPNTITPTKVVVYCLRLRNLDVREPYSIRLYSSTTASIFPDDDRIRDVNDNNFEIIMSGRTSQNDEYEYRRYNLIIPVYRQVSLNYLRIELRFLDWLFISEVEVYHMYESCKSTLLYAIYLAIVFTVQLWHEVS